MIAALVVDAIHAEAFVEVPGLIEFLNDADILTSCCLRRTQAVSGRRLSAKSTFHPVGTWDGIFAQLAGVSDQLAQVALLCSKRGRTLRMRFC